MAPRRSALVVLAFPLVLSSLVVLASLAFSGPCLAAEAPSGLDTPPPDATVPATPPPGITTPAAGAAAGSGKGGISNPGIDNPAEAAKTANPDGESDEFITMKKNAYAGDKEAQYHVGEHYDQRLGLGADFGEAAKWYQRAAAQGQPDAQFKLGECYQKAMGLPQDYEKAYFWMSLGTVAKKSKAYAAVRGEVEKELTPEQVTALKQKMAAWKPVPPKVVPPDQQTAAVPAAPASPTGIAFPTQLAP